MISLAGTAIRESVDIIRSAGGIPVGVVIALDRMERVGAVGETLSEKSAIQVIDEHCYGVLVVCNRRLTDGSLCVE